ncbi:hypothetical protein EV182_006860 [Spiromyces aspiralis]|uniref:Uncharacterized protein n=1 Tax=Spiromyces aspiralis TaxID=68401 RepID=A0ACC1HT66_9FUNG|nr:hypothetical protein EV182_006860 [Spiromyces aspiralis]
MTVTETDASAIPSSVDIQKRDSTGGRENIGQALFKRGGKSESGSSDEGSPGDGEDGTGGEESGGESGGNPLEEEIGNGAEAGSVDNDSSSKDGTDGGSSKSAASSEGGSASGDNSGLYTGGSGDGTYYKVGLGSCGKTNSNDELVAAASQELMGSKGNGPYCGKKAKVTHGGKSVTVTIVDTCPPCTKGSLDLSPTAFKQLADLDEGRIPITWELL